jgi:hypothetical protein
MTLLRTTPTYHVKYMQEVDCPYKDSDTGLQMQYVLKNKETGVVEVCSSTLPGILAAAIQAEAAIKHFTQELNGESPTSADTTTSNIRHLH